jgi:hypothetical protein
MHFPHKLDWLIRYRFVSFAVCFGCSNPCSSDGAINRCVYNVYFEFNPPIAARNQIEMTVSAGDANYTAVFTPNSHSGSEVNLQVALDSSGYSMSTATLSFVAPPNLSYSVMADGLTVATGTVSPNYGQVNKGSAECADYCTQAVVDVTH